MIVGAPVGVDEAVPPDPLSVVVAVVVPVSVDVAATPSVKVRDTVVESSPLARTVKRYDPSGSE